MDPKSYLEKTHRESQENQDAFYREYGDLLIEASRMMGRCIQSGGKVLIFGNGGSAADAQHMAAEMVGRMLLERRPLPAIALTTDTSNLTAIANDFAYDEVFEKQVQALAKPGDLAIGISTSGNSRNVILGVKKAREIGCKVISLTGGSGGELKGLGDIALNVSLGQNSSRTQEVHIFAIHSLVDLLDRFFLED